MLNTPQSCCSGSSHRIHGERDRDFFHNHKPFVISVAIGFQAMEVRHKIVQFFARATAGDFGLSGSSFREV